MGYVWDFQIVWEYRQVFVRGAIITAELTFWSTLIGTALGLMLGLMRRSSNAAVRFPAAIYIESFRATPILVQLVWIYYSMPILSGLQLGNIASCAIGISGCTPPPTSLKSFAPAWNPSTRVNGTRRSPSACVTLE